MVRLELVELVYDLMLKLLSLGVSVLVNIFDLLLERSSVDVLFADQFIIIICALSCFRMLRSRINSIRTYGCLLFLKLLSALWERYRFEDTASQKH